MPANPLTRAERVALQVAKTLARLYFARAHGQPWPTAEQLEVALLVAAEYVLTPGVVAAARAAGTGS